MFVHLLKKLQSQNKIENFGRTVYLIFEISIQCELKN